MTSRYVDSLISGSKLRDSWSTSPSAIEQMVSAKLDRMSASPSSTSVRQVCAYMKSPTRIASLAPKRAFALGWPRRVSAPSTTSSCRSEALCRYSAASAICTARGPRYPHSRAESRTRSGRMRLPPLAKVCSATSGMRGATERIPSRSARSTRARSSAKGATMRSISGGGINSLPASGRARRTLPPASESVKKAASSFA